MQPQFDKSCPSHDQLRQLLGGSLDVGSEQTIELHVETCESCGQTLEDICQTVDAERWKYLAGTSKDRLEQSGRTKNASSAKSSNRRQNITVRIDRDHLKNAPKIDGFEISSVAGKGGMGVVYRANQLSLNRIVAIKTLHSSAPGDLERIERFKNEADSIARIQHPNVVSIHEIGDHEGSPYLVLEYIHGPDLSQLIKKAAPFDNFSSAQLIQKIALAVHVAHQQQLIHRDLKPANIMMQLAEDEDSSTVSLKHYEPKITDFGLAKSFEFDNKTQTSVLVGTPGYMAPEQITCPEDWAQPAVDVYALGIILYEMLTGNVPFQAKSTFELFKKIETHDPIPIRSINRSIPKDLDAICLKCLEKKPVARYASTKQLADDLDRFLRREPVTARKPNLFGRLKKALVWNKLQFALSIVFLASITLLGTLLLNVHRQRQTALRNHDNRLLHARQIFETAKSSSNINSNDWERASEEANRAIEIQTKYPQLTDGYESRDLAEEIGFHRSARKLNQDIDELLFQFVFAPSQETRDRLHLGTEVAFEKFELAPTDNYKIKVVIDRLKSLDPKSLEGVVTTVYHALLNDRELNDREWYEQLVFELDPSDWRMSAYQAAQTGNVDSAAKLIENPDLQVSPASLSDFSLSLNSNTNVDERQIVDFLKICHLRFPSSFWLNFQLSNFIRRCDHTRNAIPYFRAAIAQRESSEMRLRLGSMFSEMRSFESAEKEYLTVLEIDPENTEVYRHLASCFRSQKRYSEAIENFKIALELQPNQDFTRQELLKTYLEAKQDEEARQYALKLVARETADHETYHSKAVAYDKLGKLDLAVENYRYAIEADEGCLKCLLELADIYRRQGKLDEARIELERLLELRPNIVSVLHLMMRICSAQKDWVSAIKYAEKRVAVSPTTPGYLAELADIYVKAGELELAEDTYLKSQSYIRGKNTYALEKLAEVYQQQEKFILAESAFRRAIRVNPLASFSHAKLIAVLCKMEEQDKALAAAKDYVAKLPNSVHSHIWLMNVYTQRNEFDLAIEVFKAGQKIDSVPPKHFTKPLFKRLTASSEQTQPDPQQ